MDVTADTDGLREEVDRKLARAFDANVDLKLPTRQAMQAALDKRVGRGLKLAVQIDLPARAAMQTQLDKRVGKGLKLKVASLDLPLKRAMQTQLDTRVGKGLRLKVNLDVNDASFLPVIAKQKAAQQAVTALEAKELAKRETARVNSLNRTAEALIKQQAKLAAERELLEDRTNARLEILNEQHFNRLNAQTAAAALRREVIEANLAARLTAQNQAFEQRRQYAFEQTQRKLQSQASKPILQSVLINANELNRSLGDFDRTVSRVLRTSLVAFTAWSAGVEIAVAAAATAAVVSFARVELAATQTASVVAAQTVSDEIIAQGKAISDFSSIVDREFDRVIEKADEVALDTLFDTGDIVGAIDAAVKAGQDLDDAMETVAASANFAQVNQLDASEASERLAAGLAAAGIEAENSAALIDKISFVAASALGDASDYLESFANRAAASARAFGYSTDEVLLMLQLLGQAGTLGREAGTQANIVFRELGRAAGRAAEAWEKYGIEANAPLAEQLVQLAAVADETRRLRGRAGVAGLAEELGLTYRSISSILQVLPQVNKLGLQGLRNLERGIASSGGLVDQQAEQVRKTIAFQWDNLLNTVAINARRFAARLQPELSGLFDVFGGEEGLINQAGDQLEEFGDRFAVVVDRVAAYVQTDAFTNAISTLVEAVEVTLAGVSDTFTAFAAAFNDAKPAQSTFESIADTILAFSQTAATVLPAVARILGEVFDFLIDNADAFETFAKLTVGVYLARKAFGLLVVPALASFNAIDKARKALIAWSAAENIGVVKSAAVAIATQFGLISRSADVAAASIGRLTAAQSAQATASIGAGLTNAAAGAAATNFVPLRKIPLRSGQAEQITRRAALEGVDELGSNAATGALAADRVRQTKGMADALNKLNPQLAKTSSLLRQVATGLGKLGLVAAIVTGAFDLIVGAVQGFRDRWAELMEGESFEQFRVGLEGIRTVLGWLGDALSFVSDAIRAEGAKWGAAMAESVFAVVSALGYAINFVKAAKDAIVDAFYAIIREVGDAIATFTRGLAGMLARMGRLPGGGKFREWADELHGAADAADEWGTRVDDAAKTTENALAPIPKWLRNTRDGTWELNEEWKRNQRIMADAGKNAGSAAKRIADSVLAHIPGATAALKNFNEALRTAAANNAADAEFTRVFNTLTAGNVGNLTPESQVDVLERAGNAAAVARARVLGLYPAAKQVAAASREAAGALSRGASGGDGPSGSLDDAATSAAESTDRLTTAAEQASAAVDNMTGKALQAKAIEVIGKATRGAADGYKATRIEAEVLRRVLPALEADLEGQRAAVQRLDDALADLQSTQLKGTKAFSDQQFGLDQQTKALELQRIDLVIAGTSEEDPAITAIDEQINALRQQAERARLVESLELDPLRRKLEDTFQPVKELSFDQIMAQFQQINKQRAPLIDAITGGEQLKVVLDRTIADAEQRFEGAGAQVSAGLARGITAGTKTVRDAGKKSGDAAFAGLDSVMEFGSPSRAMHRHGVWAAQGLAQGIEAATPQVVTAATTSGADTMGGFLAGLKQGFGSPEDVGSVAWYLNVFIPKWIRENKGPVAYDATILVPAGHAVMEGFGKGLREGFGQVQGFVKEVGPHLGEMIEGKEFSARIAPLMADIAVGKTPDIEAALGDLRPLEFSYGDYNGPLDATLGFLHRSLSLKDTTLMAQQLAKLFGTPISSLYRPGAVTTSGNPSNHGYGLAADFSNGTRPTKEMDALYAALLPYKGKIFSELLYRTMIGGNHFNHVHAAWIRGKGFSIDSGKIGTSGFDIPGVGGAIEDAINAAALRYSIPAKLIAAVAKQESGFRPNVVSPDGGYGLMQLTSAGLVAQAKAKGNIFDPFVNVDVGARYLKTLLEQFDGNVFKALMGYNGGPGAAANPFAQVIRYANSVLSIMRNFGGARELGGPTQAGKAYLVGEKGPELHVPSRSGTVIPADQTSRILAGGSTPQYIDNSVTNVTTAATDPDIVAEKIDRKKRDRLTGVNLR